MKSVPRVPSPESQGLFITGTDTAVGKTLVATTILALWAQQGLRAAGYKPVAAGCEVDDGVATNHDARRLRSGANIPSSYAEVNPYALIDAIAPHLAAADQGVELMVDPMVAGFDELASRADRVVVEGAGGWYVPLDTDLTFADLAIALDLPVILVVGVRLGCINHALLTAAAVESSGCRLAGWVANQIEPEMSEASRNIHTLTEKLPAPCIGSVPFQHPGAPLPTSCIDLSQLSI